MEEKYPEIALMKSSEIYIEKAYLMKKVGEEGSYYEYQATLHPHKVIRKKERDEYVNELKRKHGVEQINLVVISK